ncbi:hypothetical protein F5B22DRAFT_647384 [Xylaria bambusicola]|uniref:uncharacterized protein n=1 Tax=Xylaria bambusicola TaxID=326684 RepID=UPI0020077707|nr:uncharacterized protein F5B22DRAFT_647384 [Xylaria bambusicola]KAI0514628.1 hypothetical protein F5B22DRAFT_647384 [Xylaria bambusicola]
MPVEHNVPTRYLKKEKLEELLGELFPDHDPIKVTIRGDEQFVFTAPEEVPNEKIE